MSSARWSWARGRRAALLCAPGSRLVSFRTWRRPTATARPSTLLPCWARSGGGRSAGRRVSKRGLSLIHI
eukprot:14151513-Alexandrium_andersonii.AAC.1